MIWRGKKLEELTSSEFVEAVMQNNRFADAVAQPSCGKNVREEYLRKARALATEGVRRGFVFTPEELQEGNA